MELEYMEVSIIHIINGCTALHLVEIRGR